MKNFNKILEIYLIKTKTHEKIGNSSNLTLNQCLIKLKKALQIIYSYNRNNKQILFIGLSNSLNKKINALTNHIAITESMDITIHDIMTNHIQTKKLSTKTSGINLVPKIKKVPDLIIFIDSEDSTQSNNSKNRLYFSKIPTITITNKPTPFSSVYNVPLSTKFFNENKNIFFICLNFLFKNTV